MKEHTKLLRPLTPARKNRRARRVRKALELTGREIIMLRKKGALTAFVDTPVVDRALEELVQTLKARGAA